VSLLTVVGCKKGDGASSGGGGGKQLVIAMMPKSKGNAYFKAAQKGAEEAAKELNVKLLWDGPTETDAASRARLSKPGSRAAWM